MNTQMISYETKKMGEEILNNVDELKNSMKLLSNTIDNIHEGWESIEATQYISIMREKNLLELQKLCDTLEKYGTFLKNIPTAYETLDEIFSSKGMDF